VVTTQERRRIAELLSSLPPEIDVDGLVDRALGAGRVGSQLLGSDNGHSGSGRRRKRSKGAPQAKPGRHGLGETRAGNKVGTTVRSGARGFAANARKDV
jgi:hypothetical protein